jgi:hypothetical protein
MVFLMMHASFLVMRLWFMMNIVFLAEFRLNLLKNNGDGDKLKVRHLVCWKNGGRNDIMKLLLL